ncbi:ATP-dependent RNA helicase [Salmonella enterica subsp. arizonae]|uniref:ATP-dependent RNA helicase n=1 Tax=Salmonella enterica subsp. arizonae TaxID=59203 RepID=A0A379S6T6_SALER|nr:ATP-dependent RNA helicase [Salmonella enterica subsp. arizonae]
MTAFSTLKVLPTAQLNNLNELGYLEMTPVQAASLPVILAGNDVRVQARTGSGKTAAFGLGLLHRIDVSLFQTQALVLCPTRELADQVAGELRRLARFLPNTKILTLMRRTTFGVQRDSLQHAPHIIVATPGRLLDHLQKRTVSAGCACTILVMDEADRMLDHGLQ